MSPYETIFHEARIYDAECVSVSSLPSLPSQVKLSVQNKKNTHKKLEHNTCLAI